MATIYDDDDDDDDVPQPKYWSKLDEKIDYGIELDSGQRRQLKSVCGTYRWVYISDDTTGNVEHSSTPKESTPGHLTLTGTTWANAKGSIQLFCIKGTFSDLKNTKTPGGETLNNCYDMTVAWNPDDCGDDNNLKISAVLDDDGNRFLTFIWDQGWSGCTPHYALCIAKKQKDKKSPVGLTDSERDRLGMYLKEDEVRKRGEKQSKKANGKAKEAGNKRKASEISSTPESNLVATMPDLPKLTTEIILDVFTHKSLQDQSHAPSQSERLAELGERVLELIVTDILFHQRPCLNATEIAGQRKEFLSDSNVESWTTGYQWRQKLRCHPDAVDSLQTPEETRLLFYSYVGAVYIEGKRSEGGIEMVQRWINDLMNLCVDSGGIGHQSPPPKKIKIEETQPPVSPSTLPPRLRAPHKPTTIVVTPSIPEPQPQPQRLGPIRVIHNAARQRHAVVAHTSEFSGPPHCGTWTFKCKVNGIEKGVGSGRTKHEAMENASQLTLRNLGWTLSDE